MAPDTQPIVIIGGGGAGLLAARAVSTFHVPVLVLERNVRPGVKILMSGGGKCNVTHAGPIEDIRTAFPEREARFLKHSFAVFDNSMILSMLKEEGVTTMTRPDGRVFPDSGKAGDIITALIGPLQRCGVTIRTGVLVTELRADRGRVLGVVTESGKIFSPVVIVATGGASYRKTGTTGDGFRWAAQLGHTIVQPRAALAPMRIDPPLPSGWRGVALRQGRLSVFSSGKKIAHRDGDLLFTHEGISGPAALEASRSAALAMEKGPVELRFDFFPSKEFHVLDDELARLAHSSPSRKLSTLLEPLLPNRIIDTILTGTGVDPSTRGGALLREARRSVTATLKGWRLGRVVEIPLDRGEVTAGGISLREVYPATMESRLVKGLYFCGEVLDVAGPVGGYNLQAAFSTGWTAGVAAAKAWKDIQTPAPGESSLSS